MSLFLGDTMTQNTQLTAFTEKNSNTFYIGVSHVKGETPLTNKFTLEGN
jgi:hypothetical protein